MAAPSCLLTMSFNICFLYFSLTSFIMTIDGSNTLGPHQTLKNGHTLVSNNNRFELGFFNVTSTGDSSKEFWYLGIWYKGIEPFTVVWVGNRMKPLFGNCPRLFLNHAGDLLLRDETENTIVLAKLNQPLIRHSLVLLDSGNLVINDGKNMSNDKINYQWQSFDFPSDTLLPGMKLGWDLDKNRVLTSWRMSEDPSNGEFVFSLDSPESPQLLLTKKGVPQSRWGPWDGEKFSGTNAMKENRIFKLVYHPSPGGVYFAFEMLDQSILVRLVVNSTGSVDFLKWKNSSSAWISMVTLNRAFCDGYGSCGPYGICLAEDQHCSCLEGFVANSPNDWGMLDWSDGCRRKYALNCSDGDGFLKYKGLKLPDKFTIKSNFSPKECEDYCLKECTCMAYTNINDVYGKGNECVLWFNRLVDIRYSTNGGGKELYIRMARPELDEIYHAKRKKNLSTLITSLVLAVIWMIGLWFAMKRLRSIARQSKEKDEQEDKQSIQVQNDDQDIKVFHMCTISAATNNFSLVNKVGQGGFGPVYQGELPDGQKIAVKRLSEHSNQGLQEFSNEVNLIAQLQHRNLVKLLGFCAEGEERMLVYEYVPNKSLDQFIFDSARKTLLPWKKRFTILKGIAKGLDYLHFGSRLRVIHRDLKTSNVLLDDEMNPKISDFGVARNFENEREETTRRVIGTRGYMSPEYVIDGLYSAKSDVFSFGVVALEIISGQKNWCFHHPDHDLNLCGHAWKLWVEGRDLELKDPVLEEELCEENEIKRCIQVGLLCVQHIADERPMMSQVVSMLENEDVRMSEPNEPGFFSRRSFGGIGYTSYMGCNHNTDSHNTVNGLTITALTGRS